MNAEQTVPADWLTDTITRIFVGAGLSPQGARRVAGSLVDADLRGIPSHGALLVPMYVERLQNGSVSRAEQAEVIADAGAVAVLDARHVLGQLTGDQAMQLAVDKAQHFGLGAVAVRHAFHFGGAFRYAMAAAAHGYIGIAAANTRPLMPAPGGALAVVGNNPIAIAVPTPSGDPIVLDMALSEVALGKIRLAAQEGREIPGTWATSAGGTPTTDPAEAIAGLLLPMAGPKGYGLALIVDVLTGVLSGGAFGSAVKGLYADTAVPNNCAHFFLALDIAKFGDRASVLERVGRLVEEIRESPTAPGVDRLYLPGEIEAERAASAGETGVVVDGSVLEGLVTVAGELGVTLVDRP